MHRFSSPPKATFYHVWKQNGTWNFSTYVWRSVLAIERFSWKALMRIRSQKGVLSCLFLGFVLAGKMSISHLAKAHMWSLLWLQQTAKFSGYFVWSNWEIGASEVEMACLQNSLKSIALKQGPKQKIEKQNLPGLYCPRISSGKKHRMIWFCISPWCILLQME